jgi:hypothetical protein
MMRYFKILVPAFVGCVAAVTQESPLKYDVIYPNGQVEKDTSEMTLQWIVGGGHWVEYPDYLDERMDEGL